MSKRNHSPISALSVPWVAHLSDAGDSLSAPLCHSERWCCPPSDQGSAHPSQRTTSSPRTPNLSPSRPRLHPESSGRPDWPSWECLACWLVRSHPVAAPGRRDCAADPLSPPLCENPPSGVMAATGRGAPPRCEAVAGIGCASPNCSGSRWSISSAGSLLRLCPESRACGPCEGWTAR